MNMQRALTGNAFQSEAGHSAPIHAHAGGQFTFVARGLLSLQTHNGAWFVPAGQLAWIPAGLHHGSRSRGPTEGWVVEAAQSYSSRLPAQVSVLKSSPLLIAALARICRLTANDSALQELLEQLVLMEIDHITTESAGIRLPDTGALQAWAAGFLNAPDVKIAIDVAAAATNMSRRTFTRHFEQETGSTFSHWKRQVLVHRAIEMLAGGATVAATAFDIGYENPSAFIAMFKSVHGLSPHRFMQALYQSNND